MLCTHKTTILCQFGLFFVTSLLTHISIISQPFLVGIVSVLDKSWRGSTEQFILHFNEQFRQLDEVSPPEESLPYTTRLTLLQTAVHNIPELRMVETMEEFISLSSSTPGPTMGYDNYLTLLHNACIRYDSNLKSRPSPASRAAYQHELSHDQHDNPYPQD